MMMPEASELLLQTIFQWWRQNIQIKLLTVLFKYINGNNSHQHNDTVLNTTTTNTSPYNMHNHPSQSTLTALFLLIHFILKKNINELFRYPFNGQKKKGYTRIYIRRCFERVLYIEEKIMFCLFVLESVYVNEMVDGLCGVRMFRFMLDLCFTLLHIQHTHNIKHNII